MPSTDPGTCPVRRTCRARRTFRAISCKHCQERFYICSSCYRGQEYCGELCRGHARRVQMRAASHRYGQSPEARLDHRDRQREYRRMKKTVPHQSSNGNRRDAIIGPSASEVMATTTPAAEKAILVRPWVREGVRPAVRVEIRCQICGLGGEFIDISSS
jgi:hypothetical protein